MSDNANPKAGKSLLGTFTKSELLAKLTELGIKVDAKLQGDINETFNTKSTVELYVRDGVDLAKMHHHRHCHREWICDSSGNCDWYEICD